MEYIGRAERALERLNDAVEWSALEPEENGADQEEGEQEEPEAEMQQGASVLIQEFLPEISRVGGHAMADEPDNNRSQAFVPADQLHFNVAQTIQSAIADWEATNPLGTRALDESIGDSIAAEMESSGLRSLNIDTVWLNAQSGQAEFRKCVFAALDRWLVASETPTKRSPDETDNYIRPLSE